MSEPAHVAYRFWAIASGRIGSWGVLLRKIIWLFVIYMIGFIAAGCSCD